MGKTRARGAAVVGATLVVLSLMACSQESGDDVVPGEARMPERTIEEVMNDHVDTLMAMPGVNVVYLGALEDGTPCIRVGAVELTSELEKRIPEELEGYPVDLIESGDIRPFGGNR